MSFIFEQPQRPVLSGNVREDYAGGIAGLSDIASASYNTMRHLDNTLASTVVVSDEFDRRAKIVHEQTGRTLINPYNRNMPDQAELAALAEARKVNPTATLLQIRSQRFETELSAIADQHPDLAGEYDIASPVYEAAKARARAEDEQLAQFMESRAGLAKYGAAFAGGIRGAIEDPLQVATLFLGAGPGTAKTVAGRILQVAAKEAAINGAAEAALQPQVQAWRKEVGVENGLKQALANIGFAAAFGGAFGGAFKAIGEGATKLTSAMRDQVADDIAASTKSPKTKTILTGQGDELVTELAPIRDALPPEARGAMDVVELSQATPPPRGVEPSLHEQSMQVATHAFKTQTAPDFPIDDLQMNRLVESQMPDPASLEKAVRESRGQTLLEFVAAAGGIRPDKQGELLAIKANEAAIPFVGSVVKKTGKQLDMMRETVAEAGYFNSLYGTPEEAMQKSTVNDLLDFLENDIRGEKTYADNGQDIEFDADLERARIEEHMREVVRLAGPGLPDEVILKASDLNRLEGMDLGDAVERAIMEMPEPEARTVKTDPVPGWDDKTLLAASADRPTIVEDVEIPEPAESLEPFFADGDVDLEAELATVKDLPLPQEVLDDIVTASRDVEILDVLGACNVS